MNLIWFLLLISNFKFQRRKFPFAVCTKGREWRTTRPCRGSSPRRRGLRREDRSRRGSSRRRQFSSKATGNWANRAPRAARTSGPPSPSRTGPPTPSIHWRPRETTRCCSSPSTRSSPVPAPSTISTNSSTTTRRRRRSNLTRASFISTTLLRLMRPICYRSSRLCSRRRTGCGSGVVRYRRQGRTTAICSSNSHCLNVDFMMHNWLLRCILLVKDFY